MKELTKKAIKESFLKLLEEKSYSSITVKDIVADCGVNRNTFYYHYQDMPALLEEIVRDDCNRIINEYPKLKSIDECAKIAVEFALKNKKAVMHIYNSVDRAIYEKYLWQVCDYAIRTFLVSVEADKKLPEVTLAEAHRYGKYMLFGAAMGWIEDGMKDDIMNLIHEVGKLKDGHLDDWIRSL